MICNPGTTSKMANLFLRTKNWRHVRQATSWCVSPKLIIQFITVLEIAGKPISKKPELKSSNKSTRQLVFISCQTNPLMFLKDFENRCDIKSEKDKMYKILNFVDERHKGIFHMQSILRPNVFFWLIFYQYNFRWINPTLFYRRLVYNEVLLSQIIYTAVRWKQEDRVKYQFWWVRKFAVVFWAEIVKFVAIYNVAFH